MATTNTTDTTLAARAIGARTDYSGSAATDLSAEEDRLINSLFTEGIVKPADAFEVVAGAGGTMNVIVGSGPAKTDLAVVEGNTAGQGAYLVRLDEATKTLALSAADPSLDRIDAVYLVVLDNAYDASGKALPTLAVRTGDAAATPSAPGADSSWEAYLKLAEVAVPAAAADITACTITDSRVDAANVVEQHTVGTEVSRIGSQSIPHGSATAIEWDEEFYDDEGWHSNATNPERITVDQDGWYHIACTLNLESSSDAGVREYRIMKNGTDIAAGEDWAGGTNAAGEKGKVNLSTVLHLTSGDYLTITVYQGSGTAKSVYQSSNFVVARLP